MRPSVRPSLIETQKQKKTARALGPTSERMDGGREGGTRRSRTSCTAAPRYSARNAGGAHRGRGRAGARDHDGITAPRIRARASTSPGGATRAWGRAASLTSPSNRDTRVGSATSVRPSVCSFPHASYSCEWRAAPAATVEEEEEEDDRRPGSCHRRHAPTLTRPSPDDNKCRRARTATRGRDRDRRRRRPSVVVIYDQKLRRRKREGSVRVRWPSAVGSQQWQRMRSELLIE